MTKRYEVLLVDADGTILDFAAAEIRALESAFAASGIALDAERIAAYQRINEALWRAFERREVTQEALKIQRFADFFTYLGVPGDAEAMADAYVQALAQCDDEIDGAFEFMQAAAAKVPVVVVTNGIPMVQRGRFGRSRMGRFLSGHIISGEMGFAKPDPRMITCALAVVDATGKRALMIGDEPRSDIAAANAAGVDSCWFNPAGRENPTEHVPTHEIRRLDEVLAWL